MQEFLTNNTVNCNLMSLTGYRTLVILSALLESPKSYEEINDYFFNNQYIKERFSKDTIRLYMNSLRSIGCEITRANKSNYNKHELISHPFNFDISPYQLDAISKSYKIIYDKMDIKKALEIEALFLKIISHIKNQQTENSLRGFSMFKNIDKLLLKELINHCKQENQIIFTYKSPKSGKKDIEIIADKLNFQSEKLYLWGHNITHGEYSYFRVDKIIKIVSTKLRKDKEKTFPKIKAVYELYNQNPKDYVPDDEEKILLKTNDKIVIESVLENKFSLMQKILHHGPNCKVIEPENFKLELVENLNFMKGLYN